MTIQRVILFNTFVMFKITIHVQNYSNLQQMEKENNTEKTLQRFRYMTKLSKEDLQEVISEERKRLGELSQLIELYTDRRESLSLEIKKLDESVKRWNDELENASKKITFARNVNSHPHQNNKPQPATV